VRLGIRDLPAPPKTRQRSHGPRRSGSTASGSNGRRPRGRVGGSDRGEIEKDVVLDHQHLASARDRTRATARAGRRCASDQVQSIWAGWRQPRVIVDPKRPPQRPTNSQNGQPIIIAARCSAHHWFSPSTRYFFHGADDTTPPSQPPKNQPALLFSWPEYTAIRQFPLRSAERVPCLSAAITYPPIKRTWSCE
jgi:hypothetical protein